MKFMGSKRWMLSNGLGQVLSTSVANANRFVDLFTGSGAVASFVATKFEIPVVATDLQTFSVALAAATVQRDRLVAWEPMWAQWEARAKKLVEAAKIPSVDGRLTKKKVDESRMWCEKQSLLVVTGAYGGHYYSPDQSVSIDAFRSSLPTDTDERSVALASLIEAASRCAAAPGHTAQPFQPTATAKTFLEDAWNRDIATYLEAAIQTISARCALRKGIAMVGDAVTIAKTLKPRDVVFIDPPYSGVHYSRFYHVLETIAVGACGEVSGVGRYPAQEHRPRSDFSMKRTSHKAMQELMDAVASKGASAIVTFPDHECSNGLSGEDIRSMAKQHFKVGEKLVKSKFSTLGGTKSAAAVGNNRLARHAASELILTLTPKD